MAIFGIVSSRDPNSKGCKHDLQGSGIYEKVTVTAEKSPGINLLVGK